MNHIKNFIEHSYKNSVAYSLSGSKVINICMLLLLVAGTLARLSPLFDIEHRLFWQFMSEDGYLMQTIARNMAIGMGMSTSEGTILTNGVQPLATFLYAALHYLAGGSKLLAIVYVTIFSTIIAIIATWLYRQLALRLLGNLPYVGTIASLIAALWFASPYIVSHSTNGLETGLYYAFIIATLLYYFTVTAASAPMLTRQRIKLGALLGLTFLARNDAVFFIAALLSAHKLLGNSVDGTQFNRRFTDSIVAGVISMLVALPWLIYNQLLFGSIVPISGKSESLGATLGQNLNAIPANLLEATLLYIPIPSSLETTWLVLIVASLAIILMLWIFWRLFAHRTLAGQRFFLLMLIFSACIIGYYGLFFGARHFIPRYLSALSPLLWFACFLTIYITLAGTLKNTVQFKATCATLVIFLLAIVVIMAGIKYKHGTNHMHKQVIDWVGNNVNDQQWVGAIQTGTLGYFHDRTINLDGKVNPKALEARVKFGSISTYVIDEEKIKYLVDWAGICGWVIDDKNSQFSENFSILKQDQANNLCAMQRHQ